jgi:Flp pilus assembly protein TadD
MRKAAAFATVLLAAGFFCAGCGKEEAVLSPVEELERQGDQSYFGQSPEEAADAYLKAVQSGARTVKLHNNLGNAYFRNERYNAARESYFKALDLDPEYLFSLNNIALAIYFADEAEEAARLIEEAIGSFPNISFLHSTQGYLRYREGDREGARRAFERALEISPDSPAALNNLGSFYLEDDSAEDPLPYLMRAIEKDGTNKLFHDSLGWYYYKNGMFAEATIEIGKALLYDPRNVEVRVHYASVLEWIGKDQEALKQWQEILELTEEGQTRKMAVAHSWEIRGRVGGSQDSR